jgi:hypothetical protein
VWRLFLAWVGAMLGLGVGSVVWAREPSVREVQMMALRVAEAQGLLDPGEATSRMRRSHWVPDRVSVDGGLRGQGLQRSEVQWTDAQREPGQLDQRQTRDLWRLDQSQRWDVRVRMEWRLQGLVWDDAEVALSRRLEERRERHVRLMQDVAEACYRRRRALAEAWEAERSGRDPTRAWLEVEWQTARLDAWTEGWFGRVAGPSDGAVDSPAGAE